MPIYEFVCEECGYEFEKILSFSATAVPACASCGATNVERQMGRPAIHFKGSGWYINDSKKGTGKTGNSNPASGTTGDGSTDTPKAESADSGEKPSSDSSENKPAAKDSTKSTDKAKASGPAKTEAA